MTHVIAELNEETPRYHLRKLYELSLKSLGQIPLLDQLTEEQEVWFKEEYAIQEVARNGISKK